MATLTAYLVFGNNGREAMNFYQKFSEEICTL
ncbi:putative 3-demethylubiquinone-9 3-methyltransferase (glyoxalase superfamily) [Chitinophaga terrae (ex Kim and Jung 2007)]|nr:putative 3-demethylubiquinone-9 3-methyltransferase (glyoxalase superfamily) [Chitinophaga terrae (ex Kim and Jung 2007)]